MSRLLLAGRGRSSRQTETLPLSFVLLLQVHVVQAAGLPGGGGGGGRRLHGLGDSLAWRAGAAGGAGAVRQAGVETSVASGVLRTEIRIKLEDFQNCQQKK